MGGFLTNVALPVALGVIMLGLGLSLTLDDFRRVLVYPRAVVVGLFCQVVLLPVLCFGIARAFALPPELAVGLMLLAAAPGGPTANLFSHLARGDVALNVTLTAVNSVLSMVTLPIVVELSLRLLMSQEQRVPLQVAKAVQVLLVVILPVAIGMLVRAHRPSLTARLERPVRGLSAAFLALVILAAIYQERANLGGYFEQVGLAALVFNLTSLTIGYFAPRFFSIDKRQSVAIGMEIGIHNGTLAIAVATNVLGSIVMAIPAAIYSLIMSPTAAIFGLLMARRVQDDPKLRVELETA